jgi:hypothetical protein
VTDDTRTAVVELLRAADKRRAYISDVATDPVINRIARDAREHAAQVTAGARTDEFYWSTCSTAADQVEKGSWP